jgi:hypothetical protein
MNWDALFLLVIGVAIGWLLRGLHLNRQVKP